MDLVDADRDAREPEPLLGRMRDPLRLERSRWFKPIRVD